MTTTQMEIVSSKPTSLLLFFFLLLTTATVATADVTTQELDAAFFALYSHGYTLFPNAITTSDLHHLLLSSPNTSFTLFAPPDSLLFSLDLLSSARLYTTSLLLHVSPRFLSTSDLFALPRPRLQTLLPNHQLLVEQTVVAHDGNVFPLVTVDGVRVSVPDLFIGSNIAVHGLNGILVARYRDVVNDHGGSSDGGSSAGGSSAELAPAMAPGPSWCKSCVSPANPPAIWSPMANPSAIWSPMANPSAIWSEMANPPAICVSPEMMNAHSGIKKDGGSDHDDHRGATNKRARSGRFFRLKHLFNL